MYRATVNIQPQGLGAVSYWGTKVDRVCIADVDVSRATGLFRIPQTNQAFVSVYLVARRRIVLADTK
jgi:hypothetical protein